MLFSKKRILICINTKCRQLERNITFYSYYFIATDMEYGPLYTNGIGLSDGEMMERLWSYLRQFSRMTKEMNPSHRIDVLTHFSSIL